MSEQVVGTELRISAGNTAGTFGQLICDDPYETFSLFDVTYAPSMLPTGDAGNTALFDDLANGATYRSYDLTSPLDLYISNPLSLDVVSDINNSGELFALGGAITTLDNDLSRTQYAFGGTQMGTQTRELILTTVPVPASVWLLQSGLVTLVRVSGRRSEVRGDCPL